MNAAKVDPKAPPKPLSSSNRDWQGKRETYDVLRQIQHPTLGLTRLCRDRLGSVTTYYIRMGITADGVAKGGAQVNRKWAEVARHWNDIIDRMAVEGPHLDPTSGS